MSEMGRTTGTSINVRVIHTSWMGVAQWLWHLGTSWVRTLWTKNLR